MAPNTGVYEWSIKGPSSVSQLLYFFIYIKKYSSGQNLEIAITFLILGVVWANFLWFWDKIFLSFGSSQIWKIWRGFLSKHETKNSKLQKFDILVSIFFKIYDNSWKAHFWCLFLSHVYFDLWNVTQESYNNFNISWVRVLDTDRTFKCLFRKLTPP